MFMRIKALDNSSQPWVEFEFELQQQGYVSVFGEGLSFSQRCTDNVNISSNSFAQYSSDFETYDRLHYIDGRVNTLSVASLNFMIND